MVNRNLPAPPPGFVVDQSARSAAPVAPPAGFVMDAPPVPPGFVLDGPAPVNGISTTVAPENALRPRYQDPVTGMGPFQADPSLGAGFMDTMRNVGRKQYELSGNVFDAGANAIDDMVNSVKNSLALTFIGEEELDRRAAANPMPASLTAAPGNVVSDKLRGYADQDFASANIIAGEQAMNPVDRRGRTTVDQIIADPTNIGQIAKFGVETAVESLPEMALAAVPVVGPYLFGGSMTQGIAEDRAQNKGGTVRDVTGRELVEAAPFAAASAGLERIGIKGISEKAAGPVAGIAKATAKEAATEAVQEPIELAGGTVATDNEASRGDYGKAALGGAIGGGTTGGALRTGIETGKAAGKVISKAADVSDASYTPFDLGAGTRQQAGQETPQERQGQRQSGISSPNDKVQPSSPSGESAGQTGGVAPVPSAPSAPPGSETIVETQRAPVTQQPAETKQVTPAAAPSEQVTKTPENVSKRKKVVTPDNSMEIEAEPEIVELDSLITSDRPEYDQSLQPRDRNRTTSDLQIQKIATELDPERLTESRTTDQGSPIAGADNMVESGNGRTASIRRAYQSNPEGIERYKAKLQADGYNIDGFKQPVLIRRRTTDLTPEERVRFASLSNKSQIAEMSSTEKAKADATAISDDMVDMYAGGDVAGMDNKDFVRAFIGSVVTGNESSALIDKTGQLSQEGEKRVKAALVAKAYNNPDLVENIFESADPEVKAVGNVLRDRAAEYAQLGAAVRRGAVPARFDIVPQMMEAVEIIRNARRDKKSIRDVIEGTNQQSMLEEEAINPVTEKIVRSLFRPGLGRMLSQSHIDKILKGYSDLAKEQTDNDLFGENKTQPADLLDQVYQRIAGELEAETRGQGTLMDTGSAVGSVETQQGAAPRTEDTRRIPRSGYQRSTDPNELAKTSGRDFTGFSQNDSLNIRKNVFADMGIDPDKAVNMVPRKQLELVKKAVEDKFKVRVNVDNRVDIKIAIDQLADMYLNVQFMANMMGLPASAIGLDNTLTLNIEAGKKQYLGVYDGAGRSIGLPGKTNSFAHEWLHALDHFLMIKLADNPMSLFSSAVRKDGAMDPNDSLQAAFANVLNNLFYDKSFMAAQVMDLEQKAQHGRTEKVRNEAQQKLDAIKAGNYRGINGKSDYYKGSKKFARTSDYWTTPEEMMARAYEAYAAHKINEAAGYTGAVSKGNEGYLSAADERLAQTFPKAHDRLAIFDAFDQLFARLREYDLLGKDLAPDQLPDTDLAVLDPKVWDKLIEPKNAKDPILRRLWDQEKKALEDFIRNRTRNKQTLERMKSLGIVNNKTFGEGVKAFGSAAFRSMRTILHSMERKYPGIASLKAANDRIVTRPGQSTAVSAVYAEEIEQIMARNHNRVRNVIQNFEMETWTDQETDQVRNLMQSREIDTDYKGKKRAEIQKAATALRLIFDDLYRQAKDAGIDLGYLRDSGYLTRMYMSDVITAKPEEFLDAAGEVYGIQFDNEFGGIDSILKDPEAFIEMLQDLYRRDQNSFPLSRKQLNDLVKLLDDPKANADEITDILENNLSDIREAYSNAAAQDWLGRIQSGPNEDIESASPNAGFTKKRKLPPEADVILKDFMETDPIHIVRSYIDKMANKIAIHNVMTPKNGAGMEQLYKQMRKDGMSKEDVDMVKYYHASIMNLLPPGPVTQSLRTFMSWAYTFGTVMLLGRAVFSSLVEWKNVAMKTGRMKDALRYYKYSFDQLAKTNDAKAFREVSRYIGLVANDMVDMTIDSRLGGGIELGVGSRNLLSKFFRKTLLTPLTNQQREVVLRISYRYLEEMARVMQTKGTKVRTKNQIKRDLAEYGIPQDETEAFLKWLTDRNGFPSIEDLDSPMGRQFLTAVWRFNKSVIQDPKREDKPYFASTPAGSVIYAVTSYSFAYWDNVVKAVAGKVETTRQLDGNYEAAKMTGRVLSGFAGLYAATFLVQSARLFFFDHEKWEELDEEDELLQFLMLRSLDYTGVLGPIFSFLANAATGIRYQRDLATSVSGAHLSSFFTWMQKMGGLFINNSQNTNTAEYNALHSTYRTLIAPAIGIGISYAPAGPVSSVAQGAAIMGATSNTAADNFAKLFVGEKDGQGGSSSDREPKEPKEPKEAD